MLANIFNDVSFDLWIPSLQMLIIYTLPIGLVAFSFHRLVWCLLDFVVTPLTFVYD